MNRPLHLSACCESDKGLVRSYNEDVCLVNEEDGYFLAADGMGGEAAGEVASAFFRDTVVELFAATPKHCLTDDTLNELIVECFQVAHDRILAHVEEEPSHQGMGCTAELLVYHNNRVVLGHVGDSRVYLLRDGTLIQLTTDHSFVQEQADLGNISQEQAETHSLKNLILRVVGSGDKLEVDLIGSQVEAGDIFLLCTDGLSSMVDKEQMTDILGSDLDLQVKTTMLIDQANYNGGTDNVTAVLVEFSAP